MELSQINVAAPHSHCEQRKETDYAIQAILLVCYKIGIKCTLEKP